MDRYLTMEEARAMYRNEPEFAQLVHQMEASMERLRFTPAELRCAATFAALRVELKRPISLRASDLGMTEEEFVRLLSVPGKFKKEPSDG